MGHLRRACGHAVDREHEHRAGRQQKVVPHVWRDHSNVASDEFDLRDHGLDTGFGTVGNNATQINVVISDYCVFCIAHLKHKVFRYEFHFQKSDFTK